MCDSKLYCPKCGKELAHRLNSWYECLNDSCHYRLTEENTIDISFKSKGLAKALSNLCNYPFFMDGIYCDSMESFIQSLKVADPTTQADVCSKTGPFCYSLRTMFEDWRPSQTIYWMGKEINRHSDEYMDLLKRAYKKLYTDSDVFRYAINKSKGHKLIHSIGCTDDTETLLTPDEYISLLNYLRTCKE